MSIPLHDLLLGTGAFVVIACSALYLWWLKGGGEDE